MKQKDIALIAILVIISGMASFFISRLVFNTDDIGKAQAEVVQPITTDFETPNDTYINTTSINPTRQIEIGSGSNQTPFSGSQ